MELAEKFKEAEDSDGTTDLTAKDTLLPTPPDGHAEGKDAERNEIDDVEEDENTGVPTDERYSWVVATCAFLSVLLFVSYNMSMSALFVDVSEEFSASTTITTLMFTFYSVGIAVSNIITSNILLGCLTARMICVWAGLLNAVMSITLSFAPNITTWLCLNAIKGLVSGSLFIAPVSMIGYFFKKKRSLASSFAFAGVVVAYVIFPPLASILRIQFGLRGALLIIAGIELNVIPICMLLRPPSSYRKLYLRKLEAHCKKMTENHTTHLGTQTMKQKYSERPNLECEISAPSNNCRILPAVDDFSKMNGDRDILEKQKCEDLHSKFKDVAETSSHREDKLNTKDGIKLLSLSRSRSRSESVNSGSVFNVSIAGSLLDIAPLAAAPPSVCDKTAEDGTSSRRFSCSLSTFIDTSLLKLWTLRMSVAYMMFGVITMFILAYMPAIAYQAGIDKTEAALLLTIAGCMDLVVRIVVGFIADKNIVSKENLTMGALSVIAVLTQFARYYTTYSLFVMFAMLSGIFTGVRQNLLNSILLDYFGADKGPKALGLVGLGNTFMTSLTMGALSVIAVLTQFARYYTTYSLFVMFAMLSGIFTGVRQNLLNSILLDYFGADKGPKALGLVGLGNTFMTSVNHPIIGALVDATGSFTAALHYIGACSLVSSLILMTHPICKRWDEENRKKAEEAAKEDEERRLAKGNS